MIKKKVLLFVIGIGSLISIQTVVAQDKVTELAKVPLNNYLQGQATGNSEFIRGAFHKDARIISFREGKLNNLSIDEFAAFLKVKRLKTK